MEFSSCGEAAAAEADRSQLPSSPFSDIIRNAVTDLDAPPDEERVHTTTLDFQNSSAADSPLSSGLLLTPDQFRARQHMFPPKFFGDEEPGNRAFTEAEMQFESPYGLLKPQLHLIMGSVLNCHNKAHKMNESTSLGTQRRKNVQHISWKKEVEESQFQSTIFPEFLSLVTRLAADPKFYAIWRKGQTPSDYNVQRLHSITGPDGSATWQWTHPGFAQPVTLLREEEANEDKLVLSGIAKEALNRLAERYEAPDDTDDHSRLRLQVEIARTTVVEGANPTFGPAVRVDPKTVRPDHLKTCDARAYSMEAQLKRSAERDWTDAELKKAHWKVPFPLLRTNQTLEKYLETYALRLLSCMADTPEYQGLRRKTAADQDAHSGLSLGITS